MLTNEYIVKTTQTKLFTIEEVVFPTNNVLSCMQLYVKNFLSQNSINEKDIVDMHLSRVEKEDGENLYIIIKYCNFDRESFKNLTIEERLKFILIKLGYAEEDIKSIIFKEETFFDGKLEAVVHDSYLGNFDPDETYCMRDYENCIVESIRETMGLKNIYITVNLV